MNKHAITQDEVIGEAATERSHRTVAGIEVVEYTYAEGEPDESLPLPGASAPLPVARTSGSDRSPDQRSERVAQLEQECSRLLNQLSQARQDADERIREYDKRISALLSHINERDYELLEKDSKIATLTLAQAGSRETIADDPVPTEGLMVGAVAVHDRRDDVVESLKQRLGERGNALAVAREEFAELERERARLADALAERGQQVAQLLAQLTRIEVGRGFRMDFHSGLRRLLHLDPAVATGSTDSQSGNWQASEEPTIVLEESSGPKPEEDSLPATGRAKGDGQAGNEAKTAAVKLRRYLLPLKPDVDPVFELSGPRVYVGRGVAADVCISHPTISRLHGVLYFIGGATMLEDARSSNGIFVNQQRVQQAVLKDGDVVSFGNVAFHFRVAVSDS